MTLSFVTVGSIGPQAKFPRRCHESTEPFLRDYFLEKVLSIFAKCLERRGALNCAGVCAFGRREGG